jgi:hypothetical protein
MPGARRRSAWPGGGTMGPDLGTPEVRLDTWETRTTILGWARLAAEDRKRTPPPHVQTKTCSAGRGGRPQPRPPQPSLGGRNEWRAVGSGRGRRARLARRHKAARRKAPPPARARAERTRKLQTTTDTRPALPAGSRSPVLNPRAARARPHRLTGSYSCCWGRHP